MLKLSLEITLKVLGKVLQKELSPYRETLVGTTAEMMKQYLTTAKPDTNQAENSPRSHSNNVREQPAGNAPPSRAKP